MSGTPSGTREPCTQGTRVDILERIYGWAVDSSPTSPSIFWLTGQAGSGKSTIAYTVAQYFDEDEDVGGGDDTPGFRKNLGAHFFCSRQFEETRRQKNILPTIVYHLSRRSRSYAHALLAANKFDSVDALSKQMKDLLVGPWRKSTKDRPPELPPYLVVVDALDEIDGNGGSAFLRDLLKTVNQGHLRGIKFLITSRLDPNLAELCSSFNSDSVCCLYDVPTTTVGNDITKYLEVKLPKLRGKPQLATLVEKADGLFIYAATIVRYLCPRSQMTKGEQLKLMKTLLSSTSGGNTTSLIDDLYQQILLAAFRGLDDDLLQDRLKILHTLLCTEERVSTLVAARLVSDDPDMGEKAKLVIGDLHAVLYIKDDLVLWHHASFPDFMFDQSRSKFKVSGADSRIIDMSCDEETHHALLTHSCFRVLKSNLRFNLCDLPSSFLLDSEVPDLDRRVKENISDVLTYSCRYWGQHLARTSRDYKSLLNCIRNFLSVQVLFWIEAMNLLHSRAQCTQILQRAYEWVLKVRVRYRRVVLD